MSEDIKKGIKWLLLSAILFALGIFIMTNASFLAFVRENPISIIKIVPAFLAFACVFFGFLGMITFISVIIVLTYIEYHDKKVAKYNCKLRQEIKSKLPKEAEFDVSITNLNDEALNKLLRENLKCTALFDGSTIYIKFSLPEDVNLEIDDVLRFNDNFKY